MDEQSVVVGGVDTHKALHFAAVVDGQDRVLGNESFPSTRHGYKRMLAWFIRLENLPASVWNARGAMAQACSVTFSMLA